MPDSVSAERQRLCAPTARGSCSPTPSPARTARSRRCGERVAARARPLLLRRPVPQPRQPARPLPHHRARRSGSRRAGASPTSWPASAPPGTIVGTGRYLHERDPRVARGRGRAGRAAARARGPEAPAPARSCPRSTTRASRTRRSACRTEDGLRACAREVLDARRPARRPLGGRGALGGARGRARRSRAGVVVALLPDGGERYLGEARVEDPARARGARSPPTPAPGYPFEVCGVLARHAATARSRDACVAGRRTARRSSRACATRSRPRTSSRIQREAREAGLEIVGYYHSHPDHPARPSETDRRIAAEGLSDGVIHVVVGVEGGARRRRHGLGLPRRDAGLRGGAVRRRVRGQGT